MQVINQKIKLQNIANANCQLKKFNFFSKEMQIIDQIIDAQCHQKLTNQRNATYRPKNARYRSKKCKLSLKTKSHTPKMQIIS